MANGLFPIGLPGYLPQQKCYPYDPQTAKKLLSEINLMNMEKLQCWTVIPDTGKMYLEVHNIIQKSLKKVCINIEIKAVRYSELIAAIKNGNAPMFIIAFVAEIPLPEEFLSSSFSSSGANNFFNYHNQEVDALIDSSRHEFDYVKKLKLLQIAEQRIIEDAPIIPLFYTSNAFLIHQNIHGVEMSALGIANLPLEKIWKAEN